MRKILEKGNFKQSVKSEHIIMIFTFVFALELGLLLPDNAFATQSEAIKSAVDLVQKIAGTLFKVAVMGSCAILGPWLIVNAVYLFSKPEQSRGQKNPFKNLTIGCCLVSLPIVLGVIKATLESYSNPIAQKIVATITTLSTITTTSQVDEFAASLFTTIWIVILGAATLVGGILLVNGFRKLAKTGQPGQSETGAVPMIINGGFLFSIGIIMGVIKYTMNAAGGTG